MATDYFAHATYGVRLDSDDQDTLDRAMAEDEHGAMRGEDDWDWRTRVVWPFLSRLQEKYGAPPSAMLLYTGSDDDRPGRCNTEDGIWLLGWGYPSFPLDEPVTTEFKAKASWHSWVTAG